MSIIHELKCDLRKSVSSNRYRDLVYALMFNSGFHLILLYRLFYRTQSFPFGSIFNGLYTLILRTIFASDIRLTSRINSGIAFPHPYGITIGDGVVIEEDVTIYQHVTIGRGRHGLYPRLRKGVIVYPSAVIVGGVVIDEYVRIRALTFVDENKTF